MVEKKDWVRFIPSKGQPSELQELNGRRGQVQAVGKMSGKALVQFVGIEKRLGPRWWISPSRLETCDSRE